MSLSALLSSKDERDKLIVARTPKTNTVQATDFWSRNFQKYALESKTSSTDLLAIVEGKDPEKSWTAISWTSGRKVVTGYSSNSYVYANSSDSTAELSASMTINIFTEPEFKRVNAVLVKPLEGKEATRSGGTGETQGRHIRCRLEDD